MKFTAWFRRPEAAPDPTTAFGVIAPHRRRILSGGEGVVDVVAYLIDMGQTPATQARATSAFIQLMGRRPAAEELANVMEELASVGLVA